MRLVLQYKFLVLLVLGLLIVALPVAALASEGHADGEEAAHGEGAGLAHTHDTSPEAASIIDGLMEGGVAFLIITLAAMLPLLWILSLIVHFARPYILRYLRKFNLRFGADVWWLVYVMLRDAVMILTFVISLFFFFPDLFLGLPLPVTAPLATVLLFWALLIKLTRNADDNAVDFRGVSYFLVAGAVVYLVPFLFGIEAPMAGWGESWRQFFSSSQNTGVARLILYVSLGLLFATGGYIFSFVSSYVRKQSA